MGAAKRRGSLEQRIQQARDNFEAEIDAQAREVAELDALEQRQREGLQHWVDAYVIPQLDKQHGALARADYSLIPLALRDDANKAD